MKQALFLISFLFVPRAFAESACTQYYGSAPMEAYRVQLQAVPNVGYGTSQLRPVKLWYPPVGKYDFTANPSLAESEVACLLEKGIQSTLEMRVSETSDNVYQYLVATAGHGRSPAFMFNGNDKDGGSEDPYSMSSQMARYREAVQRFGTSFLSTPGLSFYHDYERYGSDRNSQFSFINNLFTSAVLSPLGLGVVGNIFDPTGNFTSANLIPSNDYSRYSPHLHVGGWQLTWEGFRGGSLNTAMPVLYPTTYLLESRYPRWSGSFRNWATSTTRNEFWLPRFWWDNSRDMIMRTGDRVTFSSPDPGTGAALPLPTGLHYFQVYRLVETDGINFRVGGSTNERGNPTMFAICEDRPDFQPIFRPGCPVEFTPGTYNQVIYVNAVEPSSDSTFQQGQADTAWTRELLELQRRYLIPPGERPYNRVTSMEPWVGRQLVLWDGMNTKPNRYSNLADASNMVGFSHEAYRDFLHHSYLNGAQSFFVFGGFADALDVNQVMAKLGANPAAIRIINSGTTVDISSSYPDKLASLRVSADGLDMLVRFDECCSINNAHTYFSVPGGMSNGAAWPLMLGAPRYGATYYINRRNNTVSCAGGEPASGGAWAWGYQYFYCSY